MWRLALVSACALASACASITTTWGGAVQASGRVFPLPPKYAGQENGSTVSLAAAPQLELATEGSAHRLTLEPFYRLDPLDDHRSHFDVRQALYRFEHHGFALRVGVAQIDWGVMEGVRAADIVNQWDMVESVSGHSKLGQPLVAVSWTGELLQLEALYFPLFRERTFAGTRGRPRLSLPVDTDHPQYEAGLGRWQPSGALRASANLAEIDVALTVASGMSHEPRFIVELSKGQLAPRYDLLQQAVFEGQWTHGAFTLKTEVGARAWTARWVMFVVATGGIEYTFANAFAGCDVTLVAEYIQDTRPLQAPPTFFLHNVFAGARLGVNDAGDSDVRAGASIDVVNGDTLVKVEGSRRFGEHWRVGLQANLFFVRRTMLAGILGRDHYGEATVSYFF